MFETRSMPLHGQTYGLSDTPRPGVCHPTALTQTRSASGLSTCHVSVTQTTPARHETAPPEPHGHYHLPVYSFCDIA